jgi:anti-anti-sigma factor
MLRVTNLSHRPSPNNEVPEGRQEIVHLLFEGRLDSITTEEAETQVAHAIKDRRHLYIMLDFQELSFISTMGLRLIILLAKQCKKSNSRLILTNVSSNIAEVFEIAGFLPGIAAEGKAIFGSKEEADQYLEELENKKSDSNTKLLNQEEERKTLVVV